MQSKLQKYILLMFLIVTIGLLSGCPPQQGIEETQRIITEAEVYLKAVESVEGNNSYPEDYREAIKEVTSAEEYLKKKKVSEAHTAAVNSLNISKQILESIYTNQIAPLAEKMRLEIEKITNEDPDDPLKDFLPQLDMMLDKAERLQQEQEEIALNKVVDYLGQVTQIIENTRELIHETLETDISFGLGQYELSPVGKRILLEFVKRILTNKEAILSLYPNRQVTIKIKVVGYNDETGFREGTVLTKMLTEGVEGMIPQNDIERRKFLNQRLSEFRARTIGEYLKEVIFQSEPQNSQVQLDIIGRGEEIPPGVESPYPKSDSRRRICKVYSYVIAY